MDPTRESGCRSTKLLQHKRSIDKERTIPQTAFWVEQGETTSLFLTQLKDRLKHIAALVGIDDIQGSMKRTTHNFPLYTLIS